MPINFGNTGIADIKFGDNQISKVYQGIDLVWSRDTGIAWEYQDGYFDLGLEGQLQSVCWGGDKWCAVGSNGICVTSPDGVTWTKQEDFLNKIVAGGSPYTWMESVTWKENMPGGPCFCAAGWDNILTSPDGITWTRRPDNFARYIWSEVIWYGGRPDDDPADEYYEFMVVGERSNFLRGNPQGGVDWYQQSSDLPQAIGTPSLKSVAYAYDPSNRSQTIVVIAKDNKCATSNNFINWTERPGLSQVASPGFKEQYKVIWTGTQFVTIGADNTCTTSPNGVTWTLQRDLDNVIGSAFNMGAPLYDVVWTGSELCAVGFKGICATSPDGVTWTPQKNLQKAIIESKDYDPDKFDSVESIAWNGDQFCAVGTFDLSGNYNRGYIVTSQ